MVQNINDLIGNLKVQSPDERRKAAAALGKIKDPISVEPLIEALSMGEYSAKDSQITIPIVIDALVQIGAPAVEPLVEVLSGKRKVRSYEVKRLAVCGSYTQYGFGLNGNKEIDIQKDNDRNVRLYALEALTKIGDTRAVKPLAEMVKEDNLYFSLNASKALAVFGSQGLTSLIQIISNGSSNSKRAAAIGLGETRDPIAIDPLIKALVDKDIEVCSTAASSLAKIRDDRALKALILALKDLNTDVRQSSALALGEMGDDKAVRALIVTLKDYNEDVRRSSAWALGKIGNASAVYPLMRSLNDENKYVGEASARALGNIGDARAVKALVRTLPSSLGIRDIRKSAISSLKKKIDFRSLKMYFRSFIPGANPAKKSVQHEVALAAITALSKIGDASAIDSLVDIIALPYYDHEQYEIRPNVPGNTTNWKPDMRKSAVEALAKFGNLTIDSLIRVLNYNSDEVESALVHLGSPAVSSLIATLRDDEFSRRRNAVHVLGKIGDIRAVDPLINLVMSGEGWWGAISALGELGDPRAIGPIVKAIGLKKAGHMAAEIAKEVKPALRRLIKISSSNVSAEDLLLVRTLKDFYSQEYVNGYLKVDFRHIKEMAKKELMIRELI